MKNGDVGMVKRFSKKYGNKGRTFNYLQYESYVKMPVSAWCYYIPTSLPHEQAAKTNMASMVRSVANTNIWLIILHEAGKAWKSTTIAI